MAPGQDRRCGPGGVEWKIHGWRHNSQIECKGDSVSKSEKYSYVGSLYPQYRSDFPLLCSICEKEIPRADIAAVYFDNEPAVFVTVGLNCEAEVQAQKR